MENGHFSNCEQERTRKYEMNTMGICGKFGEDGVLLKCDISGQEPLFISHYI